MAPYRIGAYPAGYRPAGAYRIGAYGDGSGAAVAAISDVSWARTPEIWYSANDVNLLGNVGLNDGDAVATWKNKGGLGPAWDLIQSTGAAKPIWKAIASAGLMNNRPCVRGDGVNSYMLTAVNAIQAQPATWALVIKTPGVGTQVVFSGTATNRNQLYMSTLVVTQYAGSGAATGQSITANKYQTHTAIFSGATSHASLDGAVSGTTSVGTAGFDQVGVFSGPPHPSSLMAGDMLQLACWLTSPPTDAQNVASVTAHYGATPQ